MDESKRKYTIKSNAHKEKIKNKLKKPNETGRKIDN